MRPGHSQGRHGATASPLEVRGCAMLGQVARLTIGATGLLVWMTGMCLAAEVRTSSAAPLLEVQVPVLQRFTLPNGLRVALVRMPRAPDIAISVVADVGVHTDPLAVPGAIRLALKMYLQESRMHRNSELRNLTVGMNPTFSDGVTTDFSYVQLRIAREQFTQMLPLFSEMVLHPAFPAAYVARFQMDLVQHIETESNPYFAMQGFMSRVLYGAQHPYFWASLSREDEPALLVMDEVAVRRVYERWFRPDNVTVLITGNIERAQLEPLLEDSFGCWRGLPEPLSHAMLPDPVPAAGPRLFIADNPGANDSYVLAVALGPKRRDPDYLALKFLSVTLGGKVGGPAASFAAREPLGG
jgi:zinc protease